MGVLGERGPQMNYLKYASVFRRAAMIGVVVATATCLLGGCDETTSGTHSVLAEQVCAPDSVGTLHLLPTVPVCTLDDWMCSAKCRVGDADHGALKLRTVRSQSSRPPATSTEACSTKPRRSLNRALTSAPPA